MKQMSEMKRHYDRWNWGCELKRIIRWLRSRMENCFRVRFELRMLLVADWKGLKVVQNVLDSFRLDIGLKRNESRLLRLGSHSFSSGSNSKTIYEFKMIQKNIKIFPDEDCKSIQIGQSDWFRIYSNWNHELKRIKKDWKLALDFNPKLSSGQKSKQIGLTSHNHI